MSKKMSAFKSINVVNDFTAKYPQPVASLKTLEQQLLDIKKDVAELIKESDVPRQQVADELGIAVPTLFSKMNKPSLFKTEEVIKVLKLLGFNK